MTVHYQGAIRNKRDLNFYPVFLPVTYCRTTEQYYGILTLIQAEYKNSSITTRTPCNCPFVGTPNSFLSLYFHISWKPLISIYIILSFQEYVNEILQHVTYWDLLFSLSIHLWRLIQVVPHINSLFLLHLFLP